jgi:hypothetical protein
MRRCFRRRFRWEFNGGALPYNVWCTLPSKHATDVTQYSPTPISNSYPPIHRMDLKLCNSTSIGYTRPLALSPEFLILFCNVIWILFLLCVEHNAGSHTPRNIQEGPGLLLEYSSMLKLPIYCQGYIMGHGSHLPREWIFSVYTSGTYSHGEIRCRTPFGNCHQKKPFSPLLSSVGDLCMHKVLYYTSNDIGMLHRKIQCRQSCITSYLVKLNSSCLHCAYTSN